MNRAKGASPPKPHPGGQGKHSAEQIEALVKLVVAGPRGAGFPTDVWTCAQVVELICRRFGVQDDRRQPAKVLRRLGLTLQKRRTVAREQDPDAVEHWRKVEWDRIKKSPPTRHSIVFLPLFLDETGVVSLPPQRGVKQVRRPPRNPDEGN